MRRHQSYFQQAGSKSMGEHGLEVIVQRIPPYVIYPNRDKDGKVEEPVILDPAWQSGAVHKTSNTIYGRTWRIVRIRWLSPEEV